MKTFMMLVLGLLTFQSYGFEPIVGCQAKCMVVGQNNVHPLGTAVGESEVNDREAFRMMEKDCEQKAAERALGIQILLVSEIEVGRFNSEIQAETAAINYNQTKQKVQNFYIRLEQTQQGQTNTNSRYSQTEESLVYKGKLVGLEVCKPLRKNPSGRQQYTGPGQPRG